MQISCLLTVLLISTFVFTSKTEQSLYFLNQKFCGCTAQFVFVSDLVGNPKDRFCCDAAYIVLITYRKVPKFSDTKIFAVIYLKFKQRGQTLGSFVKKMQMEKQTVKTLIRLSALFAQTYLSENLGSLR